MTTNSEREAFEAWYIGEYTIPGDKPLILTKNDNGSYCGPPKRHTSWIAWQAARSTPSPRSVEGEAVATLEQAEAKLRSMGVVDIKFDRSVQWNSLSAEERTAELLRVLNAVFEGKTSPFYGLGDSPNPAAADGEMSEKDRIEFALRDAGFDLERAFAIAELATANSAEGKVVPKESAVAYVNADELASLIRDAKKFGKTQYCIDAFANPAGFNTTPLYDHANRLNTTEAMHRITTVLSEWDGLPEDEIHRDDMLHAVQEAMLNATASTSRGS